MRDMFGYSDTCLAHNFLDEIIILNTDHYTTPTDSLFMQVSNKK